MNKEMDVKKRVKPELVKRKKGEAGAGAGAGDEETCASFKKVM